MPKRPRRSDMNPLWQVVHSTPVEFCFSSSSSFLTNLHLGNLEHAVNMPNLPSRVTRFPLPHLGQSSPVSLGPSNSLPSIVLAPVQSGNFSQDRNLPPLPSLIIIGPPQTGHFTSAGALPRLVIFSTLSLDLTALANGV